MRTTFSFPQGASRSLGAAGLVARTLLPPAWHGADGEGAHGGEDGDFSPLTINEAKLRLAKSLGVQPVAIRITVEA